ncbi:hypothetical protein C3941_09235 [Kaistia algarum]|uniref:hypothetical protein n=1 Tax=Kaistia algarum TaxID=2083279 RepID=UPI000CE8F418|nr:hypothetical protein [Kaistia algarum]MCX5512242.1 hypothetical protein [Kaistia algarum]PPE80336.1 hypothetical protein C3941_09235 [Kaistia algarum]
MNRPTLRQQYEELELLYLENRNWLADLERAGKRTPTERGLKAQRLLILRAARNTLFRLASETLDGAGDVRPSDFETAA